MSVSLKLPNLDTGLRSINEKILNWGLSNEKCLNVVTPPYTSSDIFIGVILSFVKKNKKVLYITNEDDTDVDVIQKIKNTSKFRQYTYLRESSDFENSLLVIAKHERLHRINIEFDLIIYNDVRRLSYYTTREISEAVRTLASKETKLIVCSINKTFNNGREITIPVRANGYPLAEPKFISTRIDISKDIPSVVYEYLQWCLKINKQKVVIYVPDSQRIAMVYDYLSFYIKELEEKIFRYDICEKNKKNLSSFKKIKKAVLVTNDFYSDIGNCNIMVFFAEDNIFDYKKLVYLSGKVGKDEINSLGEAIFLANCETQDMEEAKDITRNFNKEAWEMNLLRI